jgi:hypothetical protein
MPSLNPSGHPTGAGFELLTRESSGRCAETILSFGMVATADRFASPRQTNVFKLRFEN